MRVVVISTFFAAMLVTPLCVQAGHTSAGYAVENGDVNGDFARNLCDAIGLIAYAVCDGPEPVPLATCNGEAARVINGDTNGDGEINMADAVRFITWMFGRGRAPAAPCAADVAARVVPITAKPYGKLYGEWSGKWWQWSYAFPVDANPVVDLTGEFAALGQTGSVWLLAGTFNGQTAVRTVTVPACKALFFPIYNQQWVNLEAFGDAPWSDEQEAFARALCAGFVDAVTSTTCEVDGQDIANIPSFRAQTPQDGEYMVTVPENNVIQSWGIPAGAGVYGPCVDDGLYLMLAPLSAGHHTIHFSIEGGLDVTYNLTVSR
jgi:hypothetical protein